MKKTTGWLLLVVYFFGLTGAAGAETLSVPPQSIDGSTAILENGADPVDQAIVQASEKLNTENNKDAPTEKTAEATADKSTGKAADKKATENEIPLFKDKAAASSAATSPITRMLASFAVIVAVGIAALFFSKWWRRRSGTNDLGAQIRVMTQFHLGPKKSLAIVRVAGEFILIGITDQSINMIKTLSLIDDEYGENKDFSTALGDDYQMGSLGDVVGKRLKDFKSL